jgi:hypothetical protein
MNFYSILTGNSAKIRAQFRNAIKLDGIWDVALSEISFHNKRRKYNTTPLTITYTRKRPQSINMLLKIENSGLKAIENGYLRITSLDQKLHIQSKHIPFTFEFDDIKTANEWGSESSIINVGIEKWITLPNKISSVKSTNITVFFPVIKATIKINELPIFTRKSSFVSYFQKHCNIILKSFKIDQNGYVNFSIHDDMEVVYIDDVLLPYFGFSQNVVRFFPNSNYIGTSNPILEKENKEYLIFSSILKPIFVSDQYVPLLRRILINNQIDDDDDDDESVVTYRFSNPMYMEVVTSTIEKIDIDIKDANGDFISFHPDTKCITTLHFEKRV